MSAKHSVEQGLVELFRGVFGEDLSSLVVYGSYVSGTYRPGLSDINVLALLRDCEPAMLRKLGSDGRRFMRKHRVTPLILSVEEWSGSADVFPMEYMDIVASHTVLYGEDPTGHVEFTRRNLRHEIEHQLRGSLLSLRQLLLAARGPKKQLATDLSAWLGSMSAVFRALLRLHGETDIPSRYEELIQRVNEIHELQPGPFLQLMQVAKNEKGQKVDPYELGGDLLRRLEHLVAVVDSYEVEAHDRSE